MEIKTITGVLRDPENFDSEVNQALAEGWILDKRYISVKGESALRVLVAELYREPVEDLEIKVKYFTDTDDEFREIEKIKVGDWIDLRSSESFYLKTGESKVVRLGVGMILPPGYEAIVAPRSSTFKTYGAIVTNSIGVIDNSYSGDGDEWRLPIYALNNVDIDRGDRIAQFRIIKSMDPVKITRVDHLNDKSRGGFGSTGKR